MKGDDIFERLLNLAVRAIKLSNSLSKTVVGLHVSGQLVRSSTSAGANYEEARGAESNSDFIHKLGITLKELRETRYWLKLTSRAELAPATKMRDIIQETDEMCRIIGKSVLTAKAKNRKK